MAEQVPTLVERDLQLLQALTVGVGAGPVQTAGGVTLGESEASCVVYGMPKVAWEKGGAERLLPLDAIPDAILGCLTGEGGKR